MTFKPERVAAVTVPALSFKNRTVAYVRFEGELKLSDKVERVDDKRQPATVARVVNLEDGKPYDLIAPTLLVSALLKYPVGYVGKCFEIEVSKEKVPGKQYKEVACHEIKCPAKG